LSVSNSIIDQLERLGSKITCYNSTILISWKDSAPKLPVMCHSLERLWIESQLFMTHRDISRNQTQITINLTTK